MKTSLGKLLTLLAACLLPLSALAQVNSGSNGSDGALNPTSNLVINMADHPDGIYHYTSVNIPAGVTVSFIPNAGNKPVVWLVQGDCLISGSVSVSGASVGHQGTAYGIGARGGPGGFDGGSGGGAGGAGLGPGGGQGSQFGAQYGVGGSYATQGSGAAQSKIYGNRYLLPLVGGSGGGSNTNNSGETTGGGGGGGALLVAASGSVTLNGIISAVGGDGNINGPYFGGGGSGGAVRIATTNFTGTGMVNCNGGTPTGINGGLGRVRIDAFQINFGGSYVGAFTQGFQPIILPVAGQGIQLAIVSLAGVGVAANPSGVLANPDIIIPAQQTNPIPVVVSCTNVPLNTEISVVVHPVNGPDVQAVGLNNAGTLASSTATLSLNMPRGGGIIYAKAVTGIGGTASVTSPADSKTRSLAETGWTADGERFAKMEITAALGGAQQITYITESGKRYALAGR